MAISRRSIIIESACLTGYHNFIAKKTKKKGGGWGVEHRVCVLIFSTTFDTFFIVARIQ